MVQKGSTERRRDFCQTYQGVRKTPLVEVVRKKHKMGSEDVTAKKSELKSAILKTNHLQIMAKAVSST